MNILLVEDNAADARLVQEALTESRLPCKLHWISDGQAALQWLRSGSGADLVLLDLNLPGLRGQDVLEAIKTDAGLLRTPVVVFSSSAARRDVLDAYGAHANAYLVKPDGYDGYVQMVSQLYSHWGQAVVLPARNG